jgi:hypothetical protein
MQKTPVFTITQWGGESIRIPLANICSCASRYLVSEAEDYHSMKIACCAEEYMHVDGVQDDYSFPGGTCFFSHVLKASVYITYLPRCPSGMLSFPLPQFFLNCIYHGCSVYSRSSSFLRIIPHHFCFRWSLTDTVGRRKKIWAPKIYIVPTSLLNILPRS